MKDFNKGVTTLPQIGYDKPINGSYTYTFSGNVVVTEPSIPEEPSKVQFQLKTGLTAEEEIKAYIEEWHATDPNVILNTLIETYEEFREEYENKDNEEKANFLSSLVIQDDYFSNGKLLSDYTYEYDSGVIPIVYFGFNSYLIQYLPDVGMIASVAQSE